MSLDELSVAGDQKLAAKLQQELPFLLLHSRGCFRLRCMPSAFRGHVSV